MTNNEVQIDIELGRMKSFINANGRKHIGPLIRYLNARCGYDGDINFEVVFMLQSTKFLSKNDAKYKMESIVRISFVDRSEDNETITTVGCN